jgi:hypothetical protein
MTNMMLALAVALAAPGDLPPGRERAFGDWAVTCDNVKRCEAVAISDAPDGGDAKASDARIAREPGPAGGVTIDLWPAATSEGVIYILIDGRQVGSGFVRKESLQLTGNAAEGLVRAMATGKVLTLRAGRKTLASYSLKGSAATLRYIDAEQGRAGGVTALVARGTAPAAAVPAVRPLPRIAAVRPPKGKAAILAPGALQALAAQGGCDARIPDHLKPGFHRLDAKATLVMVPCGAGPRHSAHLAFVLRGTRTEPAQFDFAPATEKGEPLNPGKGPQEIVNYAWGDGELANEPMPFYPGACGSAQRWVWDGTRFRLSAIDRLGVCMRWAMWMTAYRAEVRWK